MQDDKPYEALADSLVKYTGAHKRPDGDLADIAEKAGLSEPIFKMFQTLFAHGRTKMCCYWHYGAPNSG